MNTGKHRMHAVAQITVHSSETKKIDQTASPDLTEVNIIEAFTGDIDGQTTVRALQIQREDKEGEAVGV